MGPDWFQWRFSPSSSPTTPVYCSAVMISGTSPCFTHNCWASQQRDRTQGGPGPPSPRQTPSFTEGEGLKRKRCLLLMLRPTPLPVPGKSQRLPADPEPRGPVED